MTRGIGLGRLIALIGIGLFASSAAGQQMTREEARAAGKEIGEAMRQDGSLVPSTDAQAEAVPGYTGDEQPESRLFDDPDALIAAGAAQTSTHDAYRAATNPERTRATFSTAEILATTERATAIEQDPDAYLAGEAISAANGACRPLPPGEVATGYYEATCNFGTQVEESSPICRVPLIVEASPARNAYVYSCDAFSTNRPSNADRRCGTAFDAAVAGGVCRERSRETIQVFRCLQGSPQNCTEPEWFDGDVITYACDQPVVARPHVQETIAEVVSERRDESACTAVTSDLTCEQTSEICVDADPVARNVNGVSVSRSCWAWERSFACHRFSAGNDCGDLEANRQCSHVRDECLDEAVDGPCRVSERVYRCPTPGGAAADAPQYVCGDDVYCINGDCEPIEREASAEFKDALVALHAIGQAGDEFDEAGLTVFSGERDTCHKPVFGLINCCAGKTSGLLTAAAGGAALAGGPAAIAALATPFLSVFACSQDEMKLDIRDRMGFCHKVGSYCSSSVLGICKTKRTAYCCFESKLSRILQEQGRVQLAKPWGKPKTEQCMGFTIDEFARLDLSLMDFTEVYADFIDTAKLPDEVQTLSEIQDRIEAYYGLHGRPGP